MIIVNTAGHESYSSSSLLFCRSNIQTGMPSRPEEFSITATAQYGTVFRRYTVFFVRKQQKLEMNYFSKTSFFLEVLSH